MVNKAAPVDKPGTSGNVTSEHTSAEHALQTINRANVAIRNIAIAALMVIVLMLGFALIQIKNVTQQQQSEVTARAKANRDLLERMDNTNKQTQYLICSVVIASYGPQPVPDAVTKICGPIIAHPPSGTTSFLAPGSTGLPHSQLA